LSHFLPRGDLIFSKPGERIAVPAPARTEFNFSRVAGTWRLDD